MFLGHQSCPKMCLGLVVLSMRMQFGLLFDVVVVVENFVVKQENILVR